MVDDITPKQNTTSLEDVNNKQEPSETNSAEQKSGFVIPSDMVPLPSQGRVYPEGHPLHLKKEIEVRFLTAADEDILTSRSLLRSGKALDTLIDNCIIDKNIKADNLISGDKNAVLTFLRVTGYGSDYKTRISCPSCETDVDYDFDLSGLDMQTLSINPVIEGENRFKFVTPNGIELEFKYLNSKEEKDINDTMEKIKKATNSPIDQNITTRLKTQIISVNGNNDLAIINQYVDNMPVRDSRSLRKYIDDNNPDIIMKHDYSCTTCGYEGEVDIPIGTSFFWPDA
jgi:hypothetical protein